MPKSRLLTAAAVVVGVALIVVAVVYWVEPAHSLPGFFPGHQVGLQPPPRQARDRGARRRARRARVRLVPVRPADGARK